MTSPKKNIGKIYHITTTDIITQPQLNALLEGVVLDDDPAPCIAKEIHRINENEIQMTIVEGRYHQVKRMIAAAGNHVAELHRSQIGNYTLPDDLVPGTWRWLSEDNLISLNTKIDT